MPSQALELPGYAATYQCNHSRVLAYSLVSLSDADFEALAQDLLERSLARKFERFGRGPDGGVDLRSTEGDSVLIVQCKHYVSSRIETLLSALKREKPKIDRLNPERYILVTSMSLTPLRKQKISEALAPWIASEADILGAQSIEDMLRAYPEILENHPKLFLTSSSVFRRLLNHDVMLRTASVVEVVKTRLPLWVPTQSFRAALQFLERRGACIITGPPGIGKTTLAEMLMLHYIANDFDAIVVSADIAEAERLWQPDRSQVIYYDDFLGRAGVPQLAKNEDSRLLRIIRRAASDPFETPHYDYSRTPPRIKPNGA